METPKPSASMFPAKKGFEQIGVEAQKGGEALKKLTDALPQNKEQGPRTPFVRREHLTQRPFNNPALHTLRNGLDRGVKIKKK